MLNLRKASGQPACASSRRKPHGSAIPPPCRMALNNRQTGGAGPLDSAATPASLHLPSRWSRSPTGSGCTLRPPSPSPEGLCFSFYRLAAWSPSWTALLHGMGPGTDKLGQVVLEGGGSRGPPHGPVLGYGRCGAHARPTAGLSPGALKNFYGKIDFPKQVWLPCTLRLGNSTGPLPQHSRAG